MASLRRESVLCSAFISLARIGEMLFYYRGRPRSYFYPMGCAKRAWYWERGVNERWTFGDEGEFFAENLIIRERHPPGTRMCENRNMLPEQSSMYLIQDRV